MSRAAAFRSALVCQAICCLGLWACDRHDGFAKRQVEGTDGEDTRPAASGMEPGEVADARTSAPPDPASPAPAQVAPYPVQWSPALQLDSLTELDRRLATQDGLGFGELELGEEPVLPTNCAQWGELRRAGYVPSTTLEAQADGGALLRCEALRALKSAKPARLSFVRELPAGKALLDILPASFATAESPERVERLDQLAAENASLTAFDPRAKLVKGPAADIIRVREGDGQSLVDLQPMAWGDFDGDGVDDIAMAVRNSMTHGSYSTARLMLVTRAAPNAVLRRVDLATATADASRR